MMNKILFTKSIGTGALITVNMVSLFYFCYIFNKEFRFLVLKPVLTETVFHDSTSVSLSMILLLSVILYGQLTFRVVNTISKLSIKPSQPQIVHLSDLL